MKIKFMRQQIWNGSGNLGLFPSSAINTVCDIQWVTEFLCDLLTRTSVEG